MSNRKNEVGFLLAEKHQRFLHCHFRCVWPGMAKLSKITSFLFFCNVIRKKWVMKVIYYMHVKMKITHKLIRWFFMGMVKHPQSSQKSKFAMPFQYLEKEVRDEADFVHADKHQNFLQVDLKTLSIKSFYKEILSLMMGMIKHSQSAQSNKFAIALQYLKN